MRQELAQSAKRALPTLPFGAALRKPSQDRFGGWQGRPHLVAAHDREFECLQCSDVTDADVAVAIARRHCNVRLPHRSDDEQDGAEHRHHGRACGDGELQQRRTPSFAHGAPSRRPLTLMASPSSAVFIRSDVIPKLTNGKVTPVSGMTARLPATVTASWHSASTTHITHSQL